MRIFTHILSSRRMLNQKELVSALITNLKTWDWELFSKFSIDKATADALVTEFTELKARIEGLEK